MDRYNGHYLKYTSTTTDTRKWNGMCRSRISGYLVSHYNSKGEYIVHDFLNYDSAAGHMREVSERLADQFTEEQNEAFLADGAIIHEGSEVALMDFAITIK